MTWAHLLLLSCCSDPAAKLELTDALTINHVVCIKLQQWHAVLHAAGC